MMTPNTTGSAPSPPAKMSDRSSNGRRNHKKNKKPSATSVSSFIGKCSDIKEHNYDVNASQSGFDVFVKTTREIGKYVGGKLKDASKFWNAMDPENLGFELLVPPAALRDDAKNIMQGEVWKVAYKDYNDATKRAFVCVVTVICLLNKLNIVHNLQSRFVDQGCKRFIIRVR